MAVFWCVNCCVVMVGRSNIDIEAMEIRMILLEDLAYHTRLHCVTVNLIFFCPIFCLHRKQLQRIARYSIALDHFFVSAFNERRQTN